MIYENTWVSVAYESDEEEDDVHDSKRKTGLEHGARLVKMNRERIGEASTGREESDVDAACVRITFAPLRAVPFRNRAEVVNTCYQSADEEKINDGHKQRGVAGAVVGDQSCESPDCSEDGDDEQDQNEGRRELVRFRVAIDEPTKHTNDGDESEELEDTPYREGDAVKHVCDFEN